MAKTRKEYGSLVSDRYDLLDGDAHIFRNKRSGDVWQFRMWISNEGKHYRKSLKTTDFNSAMSSAKELSRTLSSDTVFGKQIFGINLEQLVELYLEYRAQDVDVTITKKRHIVIKTQLQHFLKILGHNTKVSQLDENTLFEYLHLRNKIKKVSLITIALEQTTINAMMKFAFRNRHSNFEMFEFQFKGAVVGKRDTFTDKEYDKLVRYMRNWSSAKECEDVDERLERLMVRDYVLISANTCMRTGEAKQLTWSDILSYEEHKDKETEKVTQLVEINIRKETSKVRKQRSFLARGGEYFIRLKERQQFTENHHLVFSMNGSKTLRKEKFAKHWLNLMQGIGITNYRERKLTWYSLRHFAITQRVVSGVNLIDLSKMSGTSVYHIEKTYLKYKKEQSRTAALKSYKRNEDGTITTTW
jgi:integrase